MESFINGSFSSSRPIHVYLSFIGDYETCRFTDRLWASLESNDLNTFWDDKKLEDPSDSIFLPHHFLKAIRQSNISMIVFSKNYASSIWCLEELSEISARIHEPRYTIFPIFYDVDPSEVQNQSNSFEKSFGEHEQRFIANKVQRWRLAMKQVANLSAWHVPSEPEPQVIDEIIKEVMRKKRELMYADVDLVGMESRVREVEELLDLGSNDEIRVVGICGMGGIGKSTLARVLYNKISHHFDSSYLVLNAIDFYSTTWLRSHKRTLMVLDWVDTKDILPSLIIGVREKQIGRGSRIIITTRDEGVLKMFEKHYIYRVKLLSKKEALQLFCKKTFKCDFLLMRGYKEQIDNVLQYANGHPMAIVLLGSFLSNRRASDWSNALVQFKMLDNPLLMKVLKESFDDLDNDLAEAFLDIACFFTGQENNFVEGILRSCNFLKDNGVQLLVEKSLITIKDQKIQMHSLLQDMGRKVVRDNFPFRPEEWSRLWNFDDIYDVLNNDHTGTLKVEAIVLALEQEHSQERSLRIEALSRMNNLRLLMFCNVKFSGVLNDLSSHLRYISWNQYPFTSLPLSFQPYKLKELILPDSCITNIWDGEKESSLPLSILLGMLLQANEKISQQDSPSLSTLWYMACEAEENKSSQESPLTLLELRHVLHQVVTEISPPESLSFSTLRRMISDVEKKIYPEGIWTFPKLRSMLLDAEIQMSPPVIENELPSDLRHMLLEAEQISPKVYLSTSKVTSCDIICWRRQKVFPCLTNLNLSGSKELTKISNFEKFPSLERLDLGGCTKLAHLHSSIAHASPNLKFINLRNCSNLVSIPTKLFSLSSLEMLNLAGCSKFANCLYFANDLLNLAISKYI